jgi:L-threonylcarbamoyladenylate synthase
LAAGEVGVIPTDTIYGVVASAVQPSSVERIYSLRRRERDKPLIVLFGDMDQLQQMGVALTDRIQDLCLRVWPGPVSLVVDLPHDEYAYLHRGTRSLALRMPAKPELKELLAEVGPLVAPSANIAGEAPSLTIAEAYAYFGDEVWYVDEGQLEHAASALVDVRGSEPRILRVAPGFDVRVFHPYLF